MTTLQIKKKPKQLPLFSNIPYSASIPSRATSKQENDFMVAIRYGIQQHIQNGGDYSEPIELMIDLKKMARDKGVVRWESLQRSYERTLGKVKDFPLTSTIHYVTEDGREIEETYWMLSSLKHDKTNGVIRVKIAKEFQQYYVTELLRHPELQTDVKYHELSKCMYTYTFMNWLSAEVATMMREDAEYPFRIEISFDEMQLRVPPAKKHASSPPMRPSDYKKNVIEKAIQDNNENPYAQLYITNADDIISKLDGRKIAEFAFDVVLCDRTPANHVSLQVGQAPVGLIDDAGLPSWTYIQEKMQQLGYCKSQISNWETQKAKVWRAVMETWLKTSNLRKQGVKDINTGGYLQTLLKQRLQPTPFKELAISIIVQAPEYRDSVIDAIAEYKSYNDANELALTIEENYRPEKQTVKNNRLLRNIAERNGGELPGAFGKMFGS